MSPNAFAPRAAVLTCACALVGLAAPIAQAEPVHQVAPGESLWQIAAANGLSPSALAAANGMSSDSAVLAGQVVRIPAGGGTTTAGAPGTTGAPASAPATAGGGTGSTSTTTGAAATTAGAGTAAGSGAGSGAASGSGSGGSITVRPGDTLSAIAARAGVSVTALAGYNGLNASALLPAGRALALPGAGVPAAQAAASSSTAPSTTATAGTSGSAAGTSTSGASSAGASSTTTAVASSTATASTASPVTTPATSSASPGGTRVTAAEVGAAANANGVPTSLARAIAWQESGFDNGAVSSVGAQGAMQVMPDTLSWINGHLSTRTLSSSSAADNVQAGTLYLQHLLKETGGDPDQAAAAYYQGLSSVRARGMYDDTKRYVENVRALRARFGD